MGLRRLLSTWVILTALVSSDQIGVYGQVLRLFEKPHFYEFYLKQDGRELDVFEPYEYLIDSEAECIQNTLKDTFSESHGHGVRNLALTSKPLIYSNSNKTLSFIMNIEFGSFNSIESHDAFVGYELFFQPFGNESFDCLRILPYSANRKWSIKSLDRRIVINIKDPSFISQKNRDYTFDFGKVRLGVIVKCQLARDGLCLADELATEFINVGVESRNRKKDTSFYELEEYGCDRSVAVQACIKQLDSNRGRFFVVHQPFPEEFLEMDGYSHIGNLAYSQNFTTPWHEKWPNNLAFKLIPFKNASIYYTTFLKTLNANLPDQNKFCYNSTRNRYCYCDKDSFANCKNSDEIKSTCLESFDDTRTSNQEAMRSVVVNNQKCKQQFYDAYSFEGIDIVEDFQRHRFSPIQIRPKKLEIGKAEPIVFRQMLSNRDMLPRACVEVQKSRDGHLIDLNFKMVNIYKTAAPSTTMNTKFELNVYTYEPHLCKSNPNRYFKSLAKVVSLKDRLIFESLTLGHNYLIELRPIANSSLCPPGLCADESPRNNRIQCAPCNKVLMHLKLSQRSDGKEFNANSKECSNYNENFQNGLFSSHFERTELGKFHYQPPFDRPNSAVHSIKQIELHWGFIPSDFKTQNLTFPETISICIVEKENVIKYIYITTVLLMSLVMAVLLILMAMYYRTRFLLVHDMNIKTVIIFLSTQMSVGKQEVQKQYAGAIKKAFNRWFPHMTFKVITCHSSQDEIDTYLAHSDQIFYACNSARELNFLEKIDLAQPSTWKSQLKIGQHSSHYEFHRIHLVPKYRSKCINILLNRNNFIETVRSILHAMLMKNSNHHYESRRLAGARGGSDERWLTGFVRQIKFKFLSAQFKAAVGAFLSVASRDLQRARRRASFKSLEFEESMLDALEEREHDAFGIRFFRLPREPIIFVE